MCNSKSIDAADIDKPLSEETQSLMLSLLEGVCRIVQRDGKIKINTGVSTAMPMSREHREYLFRKFPSLADLGRKRPEQEATFLEVGNPISDELYTIDPSLISTSILKESK